MRLFICKVPTPDGWIHLGLRDLGVHDHEQYDEKLFHLPDPSRSFVATRAQAGKVTSAWQLSPQAGLAGSWSTPSALERW